MGPDGERWSWAKGGGTGLWNSTEVGQRDADWIWWEPLQAPEGEASQAGSSLSGKLSLLKVSRTDWKEKE